jgi:hypothetical protein
MTLRAKVELAAVFLVLAGLVIIARIWLAEHDARIQAESVVKAQQQVQQQTQTQINDLAKQMADRDAAYQASLKTLNTNFQQAQTPAQVAQLASELMGLKAPVTIVQPPSTAQDLHPTAQAQVPAIDFPQAKAYIQDCESCKLDRAKLTADAATRQQQADLAQKQLDSLKAENSALQTAVRGGTVLQRVGKAAKFLIIGAAVGYVAARH